MAGKPPALVIWDWNGTLLDDTRLCCEIAETMLAGRRLPPLGGVERYRAEFRFPVIDYYRSMGYAFETETYEDVSREFMRRYEESVAACPLHDGARETIGAIHRRGIRQILLSASGREKLFREVALFGLTDCFERVIGTPDNLSRGKADEVRAFFREDGLRPEDALMIGDTDHDWEIAAALGCRCLLLISGHQGEDRLRQLGAPLIASLPEALNYL